MNRIMLLVIIAGCAAEELPADDVSWHNLAAEVIASVDRATEDVASHNLASQDLESHDRAPEDLDSHHPGSQNLESQDLTSQDLASQEAASSKHAPHQHASLDVALNDLSSQDGRSRQFYKTTSEPTLSDTEARYFYREETSSEPYNDWDYPYDVVDRQDLNSEQRAKIVVLLKNNWLSEAMETITEDEESSYMDRNEDKDYTPV